MDVPDRLIPVVKLRHTLGGRFNCVRLGDLFIKGPIPMAWLSCAAKLPGKAIQVALALFWLAGMTPKDKIKMTQQALNLFNVSNDAYHDSLPRLETAGLIKVWRAIGQRAQVKIIPNGESNQLPGS